MPAFNCVKFSNNRGCSVILCGSDDREANTRFPSFRFRSSVCRFAVPASRCRSVVRTSLPLPLPLPLRISMTNGTEFSYVIFTEQRNFTTTAERRDGKQKNGNGMVETGHKSDTCFM